MAALQDLTSPINDTRSRGRDDDNGDGGVAARNGVQPLNEPGWMYHDASGMPAKSTVEDVVACHGKRKGAFYLPPYLS